MKVFECVVYEKGEAETPRQEAKPYRLLTPQPMLVLANDIDKAKIEALFQQDLTGYDRKRLEVLARPF